jgi:hypothetical protein
MMLPVRLVMGALALLLVVGTSVTALADVLVLRNGQRIEGTLVSVRGEVVEFEELRYGSRRVTRFDRSEIRTIQFDRVGDSVADDDNYELGYDPGGAGTRERTVQVQARQAWTPTGITLRAGQVVQFQSQGEIRWGPGRSDNAAGEQNSPRNDARPMPDRAAGALIAKIGQNGDPFYIGEASGPIRVRDRGELLLGINDDYLQDNSGWFRVQIRY